MPGDARNGAGDGPDTADSGVPIEERYYDPDGDVELVTTIVFAVADAKGLRPTDLDLPPLYGSIDASSIEGTFFRGGGANQGRANGGTVAFDYAGLHVQISDDGLVQVFEPTEGAGSD